MNDSAELERRAAERLAWKAEGADAALGPNVSRTEEIDAARSALDGSLPLLIDREISRRDRALVDAATVVANAIRSGGDVDDGLDDDRSKRFARHISRAETHDGRVTRLENIAAEKRAVLKVGVKSEPRTYGPGSRQSYYIDLARAAVPGPLHREAAERLERHALEVGREASDGSAEGQRAIRTAVTRSRTGTAERDAVQAEVRAMTSGSSSGGAFVTPQYLVADWATYRTYAPSFLEQTVKAPDQGFGLQMNVPAISSIANVGQQMTENSGVDNSSPTAGYLTSPLATFVGEVDVSQLLFDQSGPIGIDEVLYAQLTSDLWTQLDLYALAQATAGAGTVTGATWSNAALWGDVAKASAAMMTSAGTVLSPTHLFMPPTFYQWATAQVDTATRPLLLPQPSGTVLPIATAPDGQPPAGYTGERILTSSVFTDGNIATSGSNSQFVLANMQNVFTLTTEPVCRAIPETLANDLTVVIQVYCQFGIVVRHAAGVQTISGAAYPASPTFA
jgi:hypothetical protein